ncbi:MAG: hypothetical protein Q9200_002469 [Gallowayella weberi]
MPSVSFYWTSFDCFKDGGKYRKGKVGKPDKDLDTNDSQKRSGTAGLYYRDRGPQDRKSLAARDDFEEYVLKQMSVAHEGQLQDMKQWFIDFITYPDVAISALMEDAEKYFSNGTCTHLLPDIQGYQAIKLLDLPKTDSTRHQQTLPLKPSVPAPPNTSIDITSEDNAEAISHPGAAPPEYPVKESQLRPTIQMVVSPRRTPDAWIQETATSVFHHMLQALDFYGMNTSQDGDKFPNKMDYTRCILTQMPLHQPMIMVQRV